MIGLILCFWETGMLYVVSIILGVMIGTLFYDIIINLFSFDSEITFWICLFLFVVLFIYIQTKDEQTNMIVITSFFGAYMIVRAFTLFKDEYPDEVYIASLFHHRELKQLNRLVEGTMLVYILAVIVLFILGFIIQYNNEEEEKNSQKGDE